MVKGLDQAEGLRSKANVEEIYPAAQAKHCSSNEIRDLRWLSASVWDVSKSLASFAKPSAGRADRA